MIVNLPSKRVRATPDFLAEFSELSEGTQEAFGQLLEAYLRGERLPAKCFKTFWIDGKIKVLEFKVRDRSGNWRSIAVLEAGWLVLIHAFHKKSQELPDKVKRTIRARVRRA